MRQKNIFVFLTSALLFVLSISVQHNWVYATNESCIYENDLAITRTSDKSYEVKNNSEVCGYTITLAAYDMPHPEGAPNWIEDQQFLGATTENFAPGESHSMSVDVSDSRYCRVQLDLIRGGGESVLKPPYYYGALAAHIVNLEGCSETEPSNTPSPTNPPVPSASAVPSPTAQPTPSVAPTSSPIPEPAVGGVTTPQSDGLSDGLGCAAKDCSGNVIGGGAPAVLGVSTGPGQILPSTGSSELLMALMTAALVGMLGWDLRQSVRNQ